MFPSSPDSRLPTPDSSPLPEPQSPNPNPLVRIRFESLAFGGEALGRHEGRVVFAPYALPGEEADVELTQVRGDFARGEIVELLSRSPDRVEPPCPYFGVCGGCSLQHASYPAQLRLKREVVVDQLRRIGRFEQAVELVLPTIGMLDPWGYRNHARFSVGRRFGELCFTRRGGRGLLRIEACPLMQPPINETLALIQDQVAGLRANQVSIRAGANTGELLVNPRLDHLADLESGQDHLEEQLFDRRFRIAAPAFFQVNTRRERRPPPDGLRPGPWPLPPDGLSMAEILALVVHDRLASRGDELLVDAYCGVGTFAILLAGSVGRVVGIEESKAAVRDAWTNAGGLRNVEFIVGKTERVLPTLTEEPDAVVLDPARAGCQPEVLDALTRLGVPKLVYVSCDPATLARDLRVLVDRGYQLQGIQPLDMFPQTYHVECVASLRR
jgi:23S rRNA (uracil1939-C5)-methyltransferase